MQQTFSVPDVSCEHCRSAIEGALRPLDGVVTASVNLDDKTVEVEYRADVVSDGRLVSAIEEAGYEVVAVEARGA